MGLDEQVDDLLGGLESRDDKRYFAAMQGVARATPDASREEVQAALARLVPVLERIPFGMGSDLAQLAGSMADYGTDPAVVVPVLADRATEALEQAARFQQLHGDAFAEVPDPDDPEQIEATLERFVGGAAERGMTEQDASMLVQAWFCGGQWVQPDAEIAAASGGENLEPPGGIRGNFNLADAYGGWIWNEGRPADIPILEGMRVVVIDAPPYQRTWNAGRAYPLMPPTLTVDGPLPADEAARWLSLVKPSERG